MNINMKLKRILCLMLVLVMVCTGITISPKTATGAATNPSSSAVEEYGLQDDVQDGVILHCWDWSFNNIKTQMPQIAAAGYTAIQTSPIQEAKEATKGVTNGNWWVLYQPKSFKIDNSGQSALGTKAEFTAMCDEAHKYGVKVIVDVVANHLGNQSSGNISNAVASDIKDDPSCWHPNGMISISNYSDRNQVTQYSLGGLPDLNTESSKIQGYVLNYLKECIDAGADGFRFDAAKHIGVSAENASYTFWENTLEKAKVYAKESRGIELYAYGEILYGTEGPAISAYTKYMSVTENASSDSIRNAVANGNASGAASSYFSKGASADKLVMWAESHDTYSNDSRESTGISDANIKKTWALVASRANASALYFVRTPGWRAGNMGAIGTWDWKSAEVIAVNKFHNLFHGESEYLASSGSIAYNERGTSGVVLVNCGGTNASVSVPAHKMAAGTYKDQITGNTFTVSNGTISGNIGSTGIAVVYNENVEPTPTPTISIEGGKFSTDTLSLTIGLKNATSGTYKVGNGKAVNYTSSTTITIGSGMAYGDSVKITLTATDGSKTTTKNYTFNKIEKTNNVAYLQLPSGWSNVYCYAYDAVSNAKNGEWPGVLMTYDSTTGYYKYEIPDTIEAARVIFYSSDTKRYPENGASGLYCEGEYVYNNGIWKPYNDTTAFKAPYENGIYFRADENWDIVNMYCWNESGAYKTWPGEQMTYIGDGIYGMKLSADFNMPNVVFNDGDEAQTADLDFVMNTLYNVTGIERKAVYTVDVEEDDEDDGNGGSTQVVVVPAAVTNFTMGISTPTTITLKWNKSASADGYVIEQYKNGAWTTIKTTSSNATVSHKVTGLNPGASYQFRIKGYVVNGSNKVYGSAVSGIFKTATVDLSNATLSISQPSFGYTGEYIKPVVTVKVNVDGKTKTLTNWVDYKVNYKNFKNPGTATITVVGRGGYTGEKSMTFTIRPVDISKCTVTINQPSFGYTGEYIKPVVTVKAIINKKTVTLTNWKDYKVTYSNFKNPGVATITVTGRGITSGTKTLTFQIRPAQVKNIKYVGKSTTYVNFKWDKCVGVTGYEVYRATSKTGTYSKVGTVTTASYKNTGLKKGTTYYYKVRAYKTVGSTKIYGNYSAIYTIATK